LSGALPPLSTRYRV